MAFPTIPTSADGRIVFALQADMLATRTFPDLSGLTKNAGDLLIAVIACYQSTTAPVFSGWTAGWTEFVDSSGSSTLAIGMAYKWSTGSETGTIQVTQSATITGHAAMLVMSIPGAHATTPPEAGGRQSNTTAAADPLAFNPTGWDAEDTLWIAVGCAGETSTTGSFTGMNAAPTNYSDYFGTNFTADVVGGTGLAVAFRQLNAASEDVGPFSVDISNARNAAMVIAVRPAPTVGPLTQNIDDTLTVADSPSSVVAYDRQVDDTAAVADTTVPAAAFPRTIDDTLTVADAASPVVLKLVQVDDTATVGDAAATVTGSTVALADTAPVTDTVTSAAAFVRSLSDTAAVADAAATVAGWIRTVADTLTVADAQALVVAYSRTVADTLAVADQATPNLGGQALSQNLADTLTVADTVARVVAYQRTVTDALTAADSVASAAAYTRQLAELIDVTDTPTFTATVQRVLVDVLAATDATVVDFTPFGVEVDVFVVVSVVNPVAVTGDETDSVAITATIEP